METVAATCPICHATREYGAELVGRYTLCLNCRARFYVEVPKLVSSPDEPAVSRPKAAIAPKADTTLDDLLWDTQQGTQFIIQSLRRQEAGARTTRWLVVACLMLGIANFAGLVVLWMR